MVKIIDTKMSRRAVIGGGAAVAISSPALIGKAIAAGEINWRCQSHWPKASSSFKDSLGVFKDELAKRTDGRFKIELFGSGEFAKGKEIYNIIRKGVVPMGTCSPAYILDEAQAASYAYGIPGTFRSSWEMQHVIKNLGIEALVNEDLNAKGVMYMSEKVYPTEMVVSKEIKTAGDFQGLKLRSSGTMLAYMAILLEKSGVANDLFRMMHLWWGGVRGGLAIGTVAICALFAAMSGISGAAVVTMGTIALRMTKLAD